MSKPSQAKAVISTPCQDALDRLCHDIENKSPFSRRNAPPKEAIMTQRHAQRRKQAIERYLAGDKIDDICRQMACSKSWLYKWKARYQPNAPSWASETSRRPKSQIHKTPSSIEQMVTQMRRTGEESGQSIGAQAIRQALQQQGFASVPSLRTIYRILKRQQKEEKYITPCPQANTYLRTSSIKNRRCDVNNH